MGGGLLQLVAYGAQDAYITGNPHITFWKVLYKRHTNFAMEAFRVNFTGSPQYGQRMVAIVNRNADLMYKTYLEIQMPDTTSVTPPVQWSSDPARRLGYQLLKKIEVEIGGQIIDTHYGEWLFLWENLTSGYDNSVKLDAMVGGSLGGKYTTSQSCGGRPGILYIPLQFWFCRNPGLALPLIALQYHEVRLNVTLGAATDLVTAGAYTTVSAAAAKLPQLKDMALYIDYIYLDVDERRRFAQQSHEYLIDQLQFGLQQTLINANTRIDLTLNHPVKELVWVFQDARKTDCGSDLTRSTGYTQPFSYDDIADRCRIQINGQDRFDERYGDYFWKVQPYQHHSGGAFWPTRNSASTTASAVGASVATATGGFIFVNNLLLVPAGVTFASIGSGTTATLNDFVDNALLTSPAFTSSGVALPNATTIVSAGAATTFNGVSYPAGTGAAGVYVLSDSFPSSGVTIASGALYVTPPNVNQPTAFNPINVYSFALQPEEHQPSGTCNFSRIDTTTLVFDSLRTAGTLYPTKLTPFNFRMYAVNYNIFRVMSGMGGLAYSN
jgi:hypothetical protein